MCCSWSGRLSIFSSSESTLIVSAVLVKNWSRLSVIEGTLITCCVSGAEMLRDSGGALSVTSLTGDSGVEESPSDSFDDVLLFLSEVTGETFLSFNDSLFYGW